ncbi:hypothetical protein ACIPDS_13845 [Kluyvera sp. NPDC087067]|uniref:hypothetical protein n=1 Tax=Kluyvera sp. NPDC087067 TaxID=3364105 RepID=UPI0038009388
MKTTIRTLLLAFIGIPLLAHGVAFIVLVCGKGAIYALGHYSPALAARFTKEDITLLFFAVCCLMLMCLIGRCWARFTRPAHNTPLRHGLLLVPALLVLAAWVGMMQYTQYNFEDEAYIYLLLYSVPWWGIDLIALLCRYYWGMMLIPVCAQVGFTFGYYWQRRRSVATKDGRHFRLGIVSLMAILTLVAGWQAKLRSDNVVHVTQQR